MGTAECYLTIKFLSCTNTLGAEIYAALGVSIVSSRQKSGVARQVLEVERSLCSGKSSCDSISIPNRKDRLQDVRTIQILVVAAVEPWRSCFARTLAVSSLY